jgi:hypothetical protein
MPKISTYTNASPIVGSDLLIGTDVNNSSATKNFLISDLSDYVIANIPASGNGLQYVLNNGNTATGDINLTGHINLIGDLSVTGMFKDSTASAGTSGQFLKSTGTATIWAGAPTLNEVLTAGNTSNVNVTLTGLLYSTEARIIKLRDYLNSSGTGGQVLMTTGSQIYWANLPSTTPNIDQVLAVGSSTTRNMTTTGGITAGNFTATNYVKPTVVLDRLNSPGAAGQVLKSTATGVEWITASLTPQDLASVLAVGNSATSNMTLTGDLSVSGIATLGKIKDAAASVGSAGQVLSSTGSALSWITLPSTPNLSQVLAAGNTATNTINLTGGINMSGTLAVGGTVKPLTITDTTNAIGTSGQVLSSTGTGLRWITPASTPTLTQVLTAGNTTSLDITTTGFIKPKTIKDSLGNVGTSGQVLTSTGTTMLWSTLPSATIPTLQQVLNAGNTTSFNISSTGDITVNNVYATDITPSSTLGLNSAVIIDHNGNWGTSNQVLSSTGTGVEWINLPSSTIPTLQQVLNAGNTTNLNIASTGNITANNVNVAYIVNAADVNISNALSLNNASIIDHLSHGGSSGQVLSSTGTSVEWITISTTTPNLSQVLTAGGNAGGNSISGVGFLFATNLFIGDGSFSNITTGTITDAGSSIGTNGQVLSSTGTTIQWVTLPSTTTPTLNTVLNAGSTSSHSMTVNNVITAANLAITIGAVRSDNYTTVSNSGVFNMYGPVGLTTFALGSFNGAYTSSLTQLIVGAQTSSTLQVGITGSGGNTYDTYFNMYGTHTIVWSIGSTTTTAVSLGFGSASTNAIDATYEGISGTYIFSGSSYCEFNIGTTSNAVGSVNVYVHALSVHSNNSAAITAGLTVGQLYRDSSGHVAVVY